MPSDKYQIAAIVDLLEHFRWTYVSFIYSYSLYGVHGYLLMLEKLREDNNLCLAVEYGLPENPSQEHYELAVDRITQGSNGKPSHVVILFLSQTAATGVLKVAKSRQLHGRFTWIASDAWGRNAHDFRGLEDIAEGALTVKLASKNDQDFDDHFSKLNPSNTNNPYLQEFWNATCNHSSKSCTGRTTFKDLDDIYKPESTVGLVKIAVSFLAQSLHELFRQCKYHFKLNGPYCSGSQFRKFITGKDLQQMLYSMQGNIDGDTVSVKSGEGKTRYTIMNYRESRNGDYELKDIGYYDTQNKTLYMSAKVLKDISWNSAINSSNFEKAIPRSVCSMPCKMGEKQIRQNFANSRCCWRCEKCKRNEYTKMTQVKGLQTYQCAACELHNNSNMRIFTSPTGNIDKCEPIVPQSISISDPSAIILLSIDIICATATVALLVIYYKNRTHRLIKATSLELSYIIWSGVIFSYISIFCYFVPLQHGCTTPERCDPSPNMHWCYFQYITFSLSFTIIYAPMLTRANRIYRIFAKGKKSAAKPRFIENHYQLIFAGILILIQVSVM